MVSQGVYRDSELRAHTRGDRSGGLVPFACAQKGVRRRFGLALGPAPAASVAIAADEQVKHLALVHQGHPRHEKHLGVGLNYRSQNGSYSYWEFQGQPQVDV